MVNNWICIAETNKLPEFDVIVWLYDANNNSVYLGARVLTTIVIECFDGWLWAASDRYLYARNGEITSDLELDYEYTPTHWCAVPKLPNNNGEEKHNCWANADFNDKCFICGKENSR